MEVIFGSNATWMGEYLSETSVWDTWCLCYHRLTNKLATSYIFVYYEVKNRPCVAKNEENHSIFKKLSDGIVYCPEKPCSTPEIPRDF